jgi:hypothetical protein
LVLGHDHPGIVRRRAARETVEKHRARLFGAVREFLQED